MSAVSQAVAYLVHEHGKRRILCLDPLCLAAYADEMHAGTPLTQADVEDEVDNREGHSVLCACCMEPLDDSAKKNGATV